MIPMSLLWHLLRVDNEHVGRSYCELFIHSEVMMLPYGSSETIGFICYWALAYYLFLVECKFLRPQPYSNVSQ